MSYHTLPSLTCYWNNSQDLNVPLVSNAMPRTRFSQILSNFHLNDNSSIPSDNKDKLYKLRPLITTFNDNFTKLYNVNEHISLDESMILFKGRSSLKQHNPMKPIKRGYKLWARADNDGYMSKCSMYQGKHGEIEKVDAPSCFGLGEKVVIHLTGDLFGKNHKIYFDTYYSSVPLVEYLLSHKVYCCGTIRSNRKYLPKDLKCDTALMRGDSDSCVSAHGIVVHKWMDNKSVHVISNYHETEIGEIERTQKDGSRTIFNFPKALISYNNNMGGIDKADFYCAIYGINRKNVKWWHRICFGLIYRAITNAYITFCKATEQKSLKLALMT